VIRLTGWTARYLFPVGSENVLFAAMSTLTPENNQPPTQWAPWLKRPGSETDHSPAFSAEIRMRGTTPPLSNASSWSGAL